MYVVGFPANQSQFDVQGGTEEAIHRETDDLLIELCGSESCSQSSRREVPIFNSVQQ